MAKLVWKRINDSITQAVDTLMLGQLIEESRKKTGREKYNIVYYYRRTEVMNKLIYLDNAATTKQLLK